MGRPRKSVDALKVIELASTGLTQEEIAALLNVSDDTISRRFANEMERGRRLCNGSLRKRQYDLAMAGNEPMLRHLGKHRLNQTEPDEPRGGNTFNISIVNLIDRPNRDVSAIPAPASLPPIASEI
jgi:hypothetical protein